MRIEFDHIMPTPLKDRLENRSSDIWNQFLAIENNEFIKIKAPSGTGKTTFIHILYHIRTDFSGTVRINNKSVLDFTGDSLALLRQKELSIIFQDLRLFPNLTAWENIELKRVLQDPIYEKDMIDQMADRLNIRHVLQQKAGICSYGEQQRIAIIRALMQPFNWLIMDEPFSHLDNANTTKASLLIEEECKKRKAGLLITDLDDDTHFNYSRIYHL